MWTKTKKKKKKRPENWYLVLSFGNYMDPNKTSALDIKESHIHMVILTSLKLLKFEMTTVYFGTLLYTYQTRVNWYLAALVSLPRCASCVSSGRWSPSCSCIARWLRSGWRRYARTASRLSLRYPVFQSPIIVGFRARVQGWGILSATIVGFGV